MTILEFSLYTVGMPWSSLSARSQRCRGNHYPWPLPVTCRIGFYIYAQYVENCTMISRFFPTRPVNVLDWQIGANRRGHLDHIVVRFFFGLGRYTINTETVAPAVLFSGISASLKYGDAFTEAVISLSVTRWCWCLTQLEHLTIRFYHVRELTLDSISHWFWYLVSQP